MIRILIVVVATVALSTANPLTALSIRQVPNCGGIVVPDRCSQAITNYGNMLQQIVNNPADADTDNRIVDAIGTLLNTICSGECLGPILAVYECLNNVVGRNTTEQLLCARQEDGTFCPVKVLQELQRTSQNGGTPVLVPSCVTPTSTTCSSTCRQSYIETRDRLGCCASSWYANSLSPYFTTFGRNFVTCNVQLTNPCTQASGAATICLNFLLLATVILLSATLI